MTEVNKIVTETYKKEVKSLYELQTIGKSLSLFSDSCKVVHSAPVSTQYLSLTEL